jgi:hypothetical protein
MKAVAALVAAAVVLLVVGFFVPLFPQTTTKDYIVSSGSVTVYESFGLQLLNCGGVLLLGKRELSGTVAVILRVRSTLQPWRVHLTL